MIAKSREIDSAAIRSDISLRRDPMPIPPPASPGATARAARAWSPSGRIGARKEPSWFNAPVPSFGPLDARLLIVGLAPGLRGANRTGRPFTGDYAGDLLYAHAEGIRLCPRRVRSAARRQARADRRPHHQRRALRAAGEQADAGGDQHLPRLPQPRPSRKCRSCAPSWRSAASRMRRRCRRWAASSRRRRSATAARRRSDRSRCSRAITARATTPIPACSRPKCSARCSRRCARYLDRDA